MKIKILIVDDNLFSRLMIKKIIEENFAEASLLEAENGQIAVDIAKQHPDIDFITLDLNMPVMDGITAAPSLVEVLPDARIGMVTANIQDSIRAKIEKLGISFITKPITEDKIVQFISNKSGSRCESNR